MFTKIVQDHIPLEIEYEMHDSGIEILDILHKGESIYSLVARPTLTDSLMIAIEVKTVEAWRDEQIAHLHEDREGRGIVDRRRASRIELNAQFAISLIHYAANAERTQKDAERRVA